MRKPGENTRYELRKITLNIGIGFDQFTPAQHTLEFKVAIKEKPKVEETLPFKLMTTRKMHCAKSAKNKAKKFKQEDRNGKITF